MVLILILTVLRTRLCSIRDDLSNIDNPATGLRLIQHWGHHSLRKVVRLRNLILDDALRVARVVVVDRLVRIVASPRTSS